MFRQFKRMWVHYIGLILVTTILAIPIAWIYKTVYHRLGPDIASLALMGTIIVVLVFAIRGAKHAARIEGFLRGQVEALQHPPKPGTTVKPFEFKIFGWVVYRYPDIPFEFKVEESTGESDEYKLLLEEPNLTRTRQKKFPEERIRKAVLTWERRDKNFCARNLEEFLELEFGNMDGVPSMPVSTFYDHRKRIRDENKAKRSSVQAQE